MQQATEMGVSQGSGAAITAPELARKARKEASLDGWRDIGTLNGAAETAGVARSTVREWFRKDMAYRSAVQAAIEEYSAETAQHVANKTRELFDAAVAGELRLAKRGIEGGKPVELYEAVQIPALARQLLTRGDPRYTHPKQEVEHKGSVTVSHAIAEARKRMAGYQDALEGEVVPEGALEAPGKAQKAKNDAS